MDEQPTDIQGKKAYEARKAERQGVKEAQSRGAKNTHTVKKIRTILIIILVIGAVGFGLLQLIKTQAPEGEDFSQAVPIMQATHINEGSPLPEYTSDPPSSGPHYGRTARNGFREEAVPDQNLIHNLEHGDIWIAYHPRVADEFTDQLRQFGASKVVITPRETNETDIALVAWGRIDTFSIESGVLDEQRIRDFIKRYINQGPEQVGPNPGGV